MEKQNIKVKHIPIKQLKPAAYNPRKWSEPAVSQLKDSIKTFGLVDPIIVNSALARKNIVIGGHFRLKVAKDLGYKTVPVVYVNIPDIKKEKELNVRLNKNQGEWDLKLLSAFNEDLLARIGFDSADLDRIFEIIVKEDDFDAEAEYKKIKKPLARHGDIYELGSHRLMCGDSTIQGDMSALMLGVLARLVFTDPPYNVNYSGVQGKMLNDKQKPAECLAFYSNALNNLKTITTDDVTLYWWYATSNVIANQQAFVESGWHVSQVVIWLKNSMVLSRSQDYHHCYEPCIVGWKEKGKHFSNRKITNLKDVFNLDINDFGEMLDVWYERRDNTAQYVHPTQKPVRLAERAIKKSSERGDIVLDVFGGSGSTLMACEQLARRCFVMELDPKYVDVIIKRWELFTDKKAVKLAARNADRMPKGAGRGQG